MSKGRFLFEVGLYAGIAGLTAYLSAPDPITKRGVVMILIPILTVVKAKLSPGSKTDGNS